MTFHEMPAERRRYPRTQIQMPMQAICLDPDGDLVERMEMVDISRGGIGAVTSRPFYPGQRVLLKLPAPGMAVRNVCAAVRRCQKVDGEYRLGIEFDHPVVSLYAEAIPQSLQVAA